MKAICVVGSDRVEILDVPDRPLQLHETRIAVAVAYVCGSDLKNIAQPVVVPQILGHEFSGMVVENAGGTSGVLRFGQRVTAFPMVTCMACVDCLAGSHRDCERKLSLGFQLPGCFAEEIVIDSRFLIPLPDTISYEQGALVEHLCCGHRLAKEIRGFFAPFESSIIIIGDGAIALADLQALKRAGYSRVSVIGKHAKRMELARKLGAWNVIHYEDIGEIQRDGKPIDICVFAAPADQTLGKVISYLSPGGAVFPQVRIRDSKVMELMRRVRCKIGRAFAYKFSDFKEVIDAIEGLQVDTSQLVTDRIDMFSFSGGPAGLLRKDVSLKVALVNRRFDETVAFYGKKYAVEN